MRVLVEEGDIDGVEPGSAANVAVLANNESAVAKNTRFIGFISLWLDDAVRSMHLSIETLGARRYFRVVSWVKSAASNSVPSSRPLSVASRTEWHCSRRENGRHQGRYSPDS
jgi:hypothetical protein